MGISYKDAGVDVERGYAAVELIKKHAKSTFSSRVMGGIGSFGAAFSIGGMGGKNPVLVSGADGVGTKLKYAFALNKHNTIGIDAVAMCVNDIVCMGAKPLFFLDYIAQSKIVPALTAEIVEGCAVGCKQSGAALIGGETAEMPNFYAEGEYDIAGFAVGIADGDKLIDGKSIKENDVLVGLASSGIHSNGFSLVRKLFGEDAESLRKVNPVLGYPLADEVLKPTRIYVNSVLTLLGEFSIGGIAHITGGGFIENIPRMFASGLGCVINRSSYPVPKVFSLLKQLSGLDDEKLYNTFNMGIGMVLCVQAADADSVVKRANELGENAFVIGKVVRGEGVLLC